MKNTHFVIPFLLGLAVTLLLADKLRSNKEAYPLENEVQVITKEFYLYYLAYNEYPINRDFLSPKSQQIVKVYAENFKWSEKGVFLHFSPRNQADFAPSSIGEPGDTFEHNAKVYKAHANWYDGFKSSYEAREDELPVIK